jgi:hypothetical protein
LDHDELFHIQRGGVQGELRQMQDQIERYDHDLKTEYKDIDKLHRKNFIGVKVGWPSVSLLTSLLISTFFSPSYL